MLEHEQARTAAALQALVDRVADARALDRLAEPAATAVRQKLRDAGLDGVLRGAWIGHPLHPILTDIPIGSFTCATVLDLVGGRAAYRAADRLMWLGVASVVPTVAAGAADWSDTVGADRRIGVVHTVTNLIGVWYYVRSSPPRRRGRRVRAAVLGLAGMAWMTVGGYLGGHLAYGRGVGVGRPRIRIPDAGR